MSQTLFPADDLARSGSPRAIKSSHLDGDEALRAGQHIVVWERQVPADKTNWFGHGGEDSPLDLKRMYADLEASGAGSGTDGDPIEGDVMVRITDSSGDEVKAQKELGDLGTLRDAASDERTERPAMPAMGPYAYPHRKLQLVVVADSASDGNQIDTADSSCRFWYSEP
ncbi:hypothetical protein [Halobellus limi]|nr:hypothetical protein [Halobellus limi]SEF56402.1 hypothetical protein SAMN04488133_0137 [Halobellus limi]